MRKYVLDMTVRSKRKMGEKYALIRLTHEQQLPRIKAGQFVEVRIDGARHTFLRRPISVNFVDRENNEMWMLVAGIGEGTRRLTDVEEGERLNCLFPLGNGFSVPDAPVASREGKSAWRPLLVGGGVGVAPLLLLGEEISRQGGSPTFLLGGKTAADVLELEYFEALGEVAVTTEDGSLGERGFVTNHPIVGESFDMVYTCGPKPMMKAIAKYCREKSVECEASLENLMACGMGACLCCVEKTREGNKCVCTEGPVFNTKELLWQ